MKKPICALILISQIIASCSPLESKNARKLSRNTAENVGCKMADSRFFDHLYEISKVGEPLPSVEEVQANLTWELQKAFEEKRIRTSSSQKLDHFLKLYLQFYQLVSEELPEQLKLEQPEEILQAVAGLELGDRTSEEKALLESRWQALRKPLMAAAAELEGECENYEIPEEEQTTGSNSETPSAPGELPLETEEKMGLLEYLKLHYPAPVYGAMKSVAVAYQSCGVLDLPAMGEDSPSVEGIKIIGTHPNGIGLIRAVENLNDLIRTHYYIRDQHPPQSSCRSLRESPLIYDYGGKPYATSSSASTLNFFRDSGSGGSVLGVDCSGYIFTAHATAGLKLRSDQVLKANQVYGVNAAMMKEPQSNRLNCLQKTYGSLKPGDLIATTGHIVMVDEVGEDPFGLASITRVQDCTLDNIQHQNFDFVISQSSPVKEGIGINRMLASYYFGTSSTMREGLKDYAMSACYKKFGQDRSPQTTTTSVVRHKGTSECKSNVVALAYESCLSSCQVSR